MKAFYLIWLLLISCKAWAQKPGTDVIFKTDHTTTNVKIDELTDADIVYFDPTAPKVKKTIPRKQVWKLVFNDGSVEVINPQPGETTGTDQITLTDRTIVQGLVVRRDDRKLYYTKPNDPSKTQYELLLTRLDRIRYVDGREETFRRSAGSNQTTAAAGAGMVKPVMAEPHKDRQKPRTSSAYAGDSPASASYTDPRAFSRVHLTVGPEVSLFSQSGSARWSNQFSGLGMNQSIGGSLRVDYRIIRAVAVSLTAGYAQWELVRNYLQNGTEKYDETIKLTRIPLQGGIKLYVYRGLYLLPEAGVNLMSATTKTSGAHPLPTDLKSSTTPVTYGASLGYEFHLGGLLLDLSGRYQVLDVKNLSFGAIAPALTEKVNFASLRLGIGFNAFRK